MNSIITLGEYTEYWYKTYKLPKHAKSTTEVALNHIHTHIQPSELGLMKLTEVSTQDIQKFLTELLLYGNKCKLKNMITYGNPLSHWTVQKIRQLLISAFTQAMREGIILRNHAIETEPIPIPFKNSSAFSIEHQREFLQATHNHRFYVAYVLLFYTGCRRSEILGLSWNNINWKDSSIIINQTLVIENNEPVLKKRTKTMRSLRSIPIPLDIKKLLHDWQRQQKTERRKMPEWNNPENLIFVNKDGSVYNPKYFSRNFKAMIKKLGFPSTLHLHSTRHTWATNMIQFGIPITDVQALGGWSRPDVLLNIYAHTVQKSHKKAINKLYKNLNIVSKNND